MSIRTTAWFLNEDGEPYEYDESRQPVDFPNDPRTSYATKAEAEADSDALPEPGGDAWWVLIERDHPTPEGFGSVALGQYPSQAAAILAMEESLLVQSELESPNGGTDCWASQTIPFGYQIILIDLDDHHHTGQPDPDEGSRAPISMWSPGATPNKAGETA